MKVPGFILVAEIFYSRHQKYVATVDQLPKALLAKGSTNWILKEYNMNEMTNNSFFKFLADWGKATNTVVLN